MSRSPKRGEAITSWQVKVHENEDGELFIQLPYKLMKKLKWKIDDNIEFDTSESLGDNFDDTVIILRNLTQETDERFSGHEYKTN